MTKDTENLLADLRTALVMVSNGARTDSPLYQNVKALVEASHAAHGLKVVEGVGACFAEPNRSRAGA